MDDDRFDTLVRSLGTPSRRRAALRALAGAATALALLTGGEGEEAEAHDATERCRRIENRERRRVCLQNARRHNRRHRCKQAGRPCAFNTNCCTETCCNKVCCAAGQQCVKGRCAAAAPVCTGQPCGLYLSCPPGCYCYYPDPNNYYTGQCLGSGPD